MSSVGSARKMKISIVLSTQQAKFQAATFKGDFVANVAKIASYGYDGVELTIRDPKEVNAAELEGVISSHGLVVPAIGTGLAWGEDGLFFTSTDPAIRRAAIERIKSHMPLAARLGAAVILGLVRGIVPEGVTHEQAMEWLIAALRECSEEAAGMGAKLILEPINRYETTLINNVEQGLELMERVGSDSFGLMPDTFHMNIEEPSIEESLKKAAGCIHHVHLADSDRWYPGHGHIDFLSVLRTLYDTGYDGFVSGEFIPMPDAETAAKAAIPYLRSLEAEL